MLRIGLDIEVNNQYRVTFLPIANHIIECTRMRPVRCLQLKYNCLMEPEVRGLSSV